jgi:hypothetical protein
MKMSIVRNTLIKQSIIVTVALVVVIGVAVFVDSLNEQYAQEASTLKSETDAIVREVSALNAEYSEFNGNLELHRSIQQEIKDGRVALQQEALRRVFTKARERFVFDNFKANVGASSLREGEKYKRTTMQVNALEVSITTDALSDEEMYGLMQEIHKGFSSIRFTQLKMDVNTPVDNTVLQRINESGFAPLVKAEMKFVWAGMMDVADDKTKELESLLGAPAADGSKGAPAGGPRGPRRPQ